MGARLGELLGKVHDVDVGLFQRALLPARVEKVLPQLGNARRLDTPLSKEAPRRLKGTSTERSIEDPVEIAGLKVCLLGRSCEMQY